MPRVVNLLRPNKRDARIELTGPSAGIHAATKRSSTHYGRLLAVLPMGKWLLPTEKQLSLCDRFPRGENWLWAIFMDKEKKNNRISPRIVLGVLKYRLLFSSDEVGVEVVIRSVRLKVLTTPSLTFK